MTFKFLPHTADIKIQVQAKTLNLGFKDSALALKKVITDKNNIKTKQTKKIKIKAQDTKSLLYNFLEEFLYLLDAKNFLLSKIKEIKINKNQTELIATAIGDKATNYEFTNDVKAITYSDMKIKKNSKGYRLEFVLDV